MEMVTLGFEPEKTIHDEKSVVAINGNTPVKSMLT